MRVEFVSPYDHSPNTGIGRYIHTLTKHLSGFIDVPIRRPQFVPLVGRFSALRNLPIGIEGHMPGSIVHFPQIMGCAMMLYRPYHPSVATVHDLGFLELPEEWEMFDPVARQILRLSLAGLKRVDLIVAVSEFTRRGVIKHIGVPPERVVTVHSGIDHDLFRPIPNARDVLSQRYPRLASVSSAPWVLYVGSELPRKNIRTLLQAFALVREESPDARLIKVGGSGGERYRNDTIRTISELSLDNNILFFDAVADEDLPLFYNAADVFVTASKLEGFGFPVLEAMACGTPVICSNSSSLQEVAGSTCLPCPPTSAEEFGNAVLDVLRSTDCSSSLRHLGLQNARLFDWKNTAAVTRDQYERLS